MDKGRVIGTTYWQFVDSHGSGEPRRFLFRTTDMLLKFRTTRWWVPRKPLCYFHVGFYSSKSTSGGRRFRSKRAAAIRHIPIADDKAGLRCRNHILIPPPNKLSIWALLSPLSVVQTIPSCLICSNFDVLNGSCLAACASNLCPYPIPYFTQNVLNLFD